MGNIPNVLFKEMEKMEASGYKLLSVGIAQAGHSTAGLFNTFKCNGNF